jgi:predicted dehydrogenase
VSIIPYHNRRWDGDFLTVMELLVSGRLGQLWRFESRFERWNPGTRDPRSWKQDPNLPGGGILFDLGSHLVDQALRLFGPPSSVYAEVTGHAAPVDDDAFVALTYRGGIAVHLWASSTAAKLGPRFRILGSQSAYVKYGLDPQEGALRAGRLPSQPGWGEEPAEAWGEIGTVDSAEPIPTRPGAYQNFYADVAEHLLKNTAPPVEIGDAITGLRVLEAAVASATSGAVIAIT